MGRIRILPYKAGSASAKVLAEALGGLRLRTGGRSRFRPRADDLVIRWGSAEDTPNLGGHRVLNPLHAVRMATDKRAFFHRMNGTALAPEYWEFPSDIPDDAFPVVCRTVLHGHSGEGIVIAESREELVDAPLYVKYVKKDQEYRVHVGWDSQHGDYTVIATQRKARRRGVPDDEVNWQVRNLDGGFIYARHGFELPESAKSVAIQTIERLGLDFGAVDVIQTRNGRAFALEVNTAPGLTGSTIEDYARFFQGYAS